MHDIATQCEKAMTGAGFSRVWCAHRERIGRENTVDCAQSPKRATPRASVDHKNAHDVDHKSAHVDHKNADVDHKNVLVFRCFT